MLKLLSTVAALSAFASSALAAPFCVVSGAGQQCYYYDVSSCRQAASTMNGMCVANAEEQQQPQSRQQSTGAPFCVVSGAGSQCYYYDLRSCQRTASTMNGACVANPN